jgi:hypothetical protein
MDQLYAGVASGVGDVGGVPVDHHLISGRWITRYQAANSGLLIIDLDEEAVHFEGTALAWDDVPSYPNTMVKPRLFAALASVRGDGRYARLMRQLTKVDLLILDDWSPRAIDRGTAARSPGNRRGPVQHRLADHHQPGPAGSMVRDRWKSHPGGRHARSHPSQRSPH